MSNNPYYEQDVEFVTGFAGSGKSTILAQRATDTTLILVPTHKSADVLINKGISNVFTIHSVLKLVPSIDDNFRGKMRTKLRKIGDTDLSTVKEIFIDEFSMIPEHILNLLMSVLPNDTQVTLFGDPYQLPPISGDPIQMFDPITELNTQYRSKNLVGTNQFMAYMHAIRDNLSQPPLNIPVTSDWMDLFDPETDRILAFTNKRVLKLNNAISIHLGMTSEFKYSEPLLANGIPVTMVTKDFLPRLYPTCISKHKLLTGSKLQNAIKKTGDDIDKYRVNLGMYKTMPIEIEEENFLIYYDPDHYATTQKLKSNVEKYQAALIAEHNLDKNTHIPTWCIQHRNMKYVMERGKAWAKYLAHTNYVFSITRPYATTVHKAQGSEFKRVFIDYNDINKSIDLNQRLRLLYVAFSRGIEETVII